MKTILASFSNRLMVWLLVASLVFSQVEVIQAAARPEIGSDSPSSAEKPDGYILAQAETVLAATGAESGADILLIQSSLPWDSTANTEVLDTLGYAYHSVDMNSINHDELFTYPVILIVNDQVQAFYDQYASQVSAFEEYVKSGGVLVFFAASDGWAYGTLRAPLPGGVAVTTSWYMERNTVSSAQHPIVSGQLSDGAPLTAADLYSNYCTHGYFSNLAPDTEVILREPNGYPTLIDYNLGRGRVIASTQTWEHNWVYHTGNDEYGAFARRALDDVFLYAFTKGGKFVDDLTVDLRIEDAPDNISVNKSAGSLVNIVARVSASEAYTSSATLSVPGDVFGKPVRTYTRNRSDNDGSGQENQVVNLGDGNYKIETTLAKLGGAPVSPYYKELVWQFRIPDAVKPQNGFAVSVELSAAGTIIREPVDEAAFDIVDQASAIVITNRVRLFNEFGKSDGSRNQVNAMLEQVYGSVARWPVGEVFYLDEYGIEYDGSTRANETVNAIDSLLQQWYGDLSVSRNGTQLRPSYLLIVGDDRIVPFFRIADDDEYDFGFGTNYLTDNVYGDIDGKEHDWQQGELELATGRIVGATADDMMKLLQNGVAPGRYMISAGLATIPGVDSGETFQTRLAERNVTLHGLANPDLVDSDTWTRDDFLKVWNREFQLFHFHGHSNPQVLSPLSNGAATQRVSSAQLTAGVISANLPLVSSGGCNMGSPVQDGFVERITALGAGGMIASTGLSNYADTFPGDLLWGEKLADLLYQELIPERSSILLLTEEWGTALLKAKERYDAWLWLDIDRKTVMEYVLYGLPWARMRIPAVAETAASAQGAGGTYVSVEEVTQASENTYAATINAVVTAYSLDSTEEYELLTIPDANYIAGGGAAAIPYTVHELSLPHGSSVVDVSIVSQNNVPLGQHNLGSLTPLTTYDEESDVGPVSGFEGLFPSERVTYQAYLADGRLVVKVMIALADFDIDTKQLTLYDQTQVRVRYETSAPVVIESFAVDERNVGPGQTMSATVVIRNVTNQAVSLIPAVTMYNKAGESVKVDVQKAVTLPANRTMTLSQQSESPLATGSYVVIFTATVSNKLVDSAAESFEVAAGAITDFQTPQSLRIGEIGEVILSFANYRNELIQATAGGALYDIHGVQVATLLQRVLDVDAKSTSSANWNWESGSLPPGKYTFQATVFAEGIAYISQRSDILIRPDLACGSLAITSSRQSMSAGDDNPAQIQIHLKGAANQPVASVPVELKSSYGTIDGIILTNASGLATATFRAPPSSGAVIITAQADPLSANAEIVISPGAASDVQVTVERSALPADGKSTAIVVAIVQDRYGNRISGQRITFQTNLGSVEESGTTDVNGMATSTFKAGNAFGIAEITVTASNATATKHIELTRSGFPVFLPSVFNGQ